MNALRTFSFTHALGKIPVIFWYKKSLIIESNVFVISIVRSNAISIVEKGRKVTNEIVLNAKTTAWVTKTLEDCFHSVGSKEFIRTFRLGDIGYIAKRSYN